MIFLMAIMAQGTTTIVDTTLKTKPATHASAVAPSDMEVQIANAPAGVTLPFAVETVVTTDLQGAVARCAPLHNSGPAAFGDLACQQVKALAHFPVITNEYGKPMGAIRKITVSFNTAH